MINYSIRQIHSKRKKNAKATFGRQIQDRSVHLTVIRIENNHSLNASDIPVSGLSNRKVDS